MLSYDGVQAIGPGRSHRRSNLSRSTLSFRGSNAKVLWINIDAARNSYALQLLVASLQVQQQGALLEAPRLLTCLSLHPCHLQEPLWLLQEALLQALAAYPWDHVVVMQTNDKVLYEACWVWKNSEKWGHRFFFFPPLYCSKRPCASSGSKGRDALVVATTMEAPLGGSPAFVKLSVVVQKTMERAYGALVAVMDSYVSKSDILY